MWILNPRARTSFNLIGGLGPLLLAVVGAACGAAAFGLWNQRRWGYRLAVSLLVVNLVGDTVNTALGIEPRAAVGIPIVLVLLAYLAQAHVRRCFQKGGARALARVGTS